MIKARNGLDAQQHVDPVILEEELGLKRPAHWAGRVLVMNQEQL